MVGILGGGISGLFLLHLLAEAGLEAILFERSPSAGGVMRSRSVEGPNGPVTVDLGPQRMRLTGSLARVVEEVGLVSALRQAPMGVPFTIYRDGRLYPAPLSVGDALGSRLVSWPGKIRALGDLFSAAPAADESVAAALKRKLGPEVYTRLAGPILGGLYASDPAQMEAGRTLVPALRRTGARRSLLVGLKRASRWDRTPVVSFAEGMGALPRAIAQRYGNRVRLGESVRRVRARSRRGYRIQSDRGEVDVDELAICVPAGEAAGILEESAPEVASSLRRLRYNPLAIVPLVVRGGVPVRGVGSGFKMTLDDDSLTRGVTSHEQLFGRTGLFTAFLGGMGREDLLDRPDAHLLETARSDFRRVTGQEATPLFVHRTAMPAWDRSWRALDSVAFPERIHVCSAFFDRPGITGRLENARRIAGLIEGRSRSPKGAWGSA